MVNRLKLDITQHDVLQYYRNDYDSLILLLSHGAEGTIIDPTTLDTLAMDTQSVHTTLINANLRQHIHEAKSVLGDSSPSLSVDTALSLIDHASDETIRRAQADVRTAAGMDIERVRDSIRESTRRFFSSSFQNVSGAVMSSGAEAIRLVHNRLKLALNDDDEEVQVALFSGLLKAGNEYGWGHQSCQSGSISIVLSTLQGRISLDRNTESGKQVADLPSEANAYFELLKKVRDAGLHPDTLQAEAVARIASQDDSKRLQEIYDSFVLDHRHYAWAVNDLRGFFFGALAVEYEHLLVKLRFVEHEGTVRRRVTMLPGLQELLLNLAGLSSLLTEAVAVPSENIPKILGAAIGAGGGSSGTSPECKRRRVKN